MTDGGATSEDRPGTGADGAGGACRDGDARAKDERPSGDTSEGAGGPATEHAPPPGRARRQGHLLPAPVAVSWNDRQRRPVSFVWRHRRYRVERVLETWVLETGWWKDDGHVSRLYWRVRAEGRVFDLRYDRIGRAWVLEQALN